jgi:hypothetical protein
VVLTVAEALAWYLIRMYDEQHLSFTSKHKRLSRVSRLRFDSSPSQSDMSWSWGKRASEESKSAGQQSQTMNKELDIGDGHWVSATILNCTENRS